MAHFAEIDENNVVLRILVVPDEQEDRGQEFLAEDLGLGGIWLKTSYNTRGGIHYDSETGEPSKDQSKSLRKNYASVGSLYDSEKDAFIPPKLFESWILNEESFLWQPPMPMPEEGEWIWNEELVDWEEIPSE
jgi:hypothetical protein